MGVLTGRHISEVQYFCMSILIAIEHVEKIKDRDQRVRCALVAAGADFGKLFPDYVTKKITDDSAEIEESTDAEGEPISTTYDFSNATYDAKAVEEEIREIMARAAVGSATFDQPQYTDWV